MSNDKQEATYHGRRRSFAVGDWVYVTQLPEFDHQLGQVVEIMDSMRPYTVRFEADEYAVFDWLALMPYTQRVQSRIPSASNLGNYPHLLRSREEHETTGEHVFHKLGDDLYQDWADGPAHMKPKRDHWTPTPGELGLALGIMAFIVLLFVFLVFFYRGW